MNRSSPHRIPHWSLSAHVPSACFAALPTLHPVVAVASSSAGITKLNSCQEKESPRPLERRDSGVVWFATLQFTRIFNNLTEGSHGVAATFGHLSVVLEMRYVRGGESPVQGKPAPRRLHASARASANCRARTDRRSGQSAAWARIQVVRLHRDGSSPRRNSWCRAQRRCGPEQTRELVGPSRQPGNCARFCAISPV